MQRIQPSGRVGRLLRYVATTFFVPAFLFACTVGNSYISAASEFFITASGAMLLPWVWGLVRLPFTGVFLREDELVVRTWWTLKSYPREEIVRCRDEMYSGIMYIAGWTVVDGVFQSGHLTLETVTGNAALPGTVTSRTVARNQSEQVNAWLKLPVGEADGTRRQARKARQSDG